MHVQCRGAECRGMIEEVQVQNCRGVQVPRCKGGPEVQGAGCRVQVQRCRVVDL
jgi:hypothetical protein